MSETMAFLELDTNEEINLLSDELFNVIEAFMKLIKGAGSGILLPQSGPIAE
ncbi:hypothetical protein JQN58_18000 [Aneurinibacillus sp. BA2021]|nr:hypothetical protein [Aneurinibacillus sp. BA2021]